jgi:hypothetical protein
MLAEIEGNIRGIKSFKSKKGNDLFRYRVEMTGFQGEPYLVDVISNKNTRKKGVQKIRVNISNRIGADGKLRGGLSLFEATEV